MRRDIKPAGWEAPTGWGHPYVFPPMTVDGVKVEQIMYQNTDRLILRAVAPQEAEDSATSSNDKEETSE